jgi:creatinine amidohydrolase
MTSPLLSELTYGSVRQAPPRLAVLPWGATEAHNYHLPYGTDNIETEWIAAASVREANTRGAEAIALPVIPFGVNTGQLAIPWTINMNPSTQMEILRDILFSLQEQKISRLVILNGHGGNDFRQMIRELRPQFAVLMATVNWYRTLPLREYFENPGDHADEMETSVMLHIAPHLVRPLGEAGDGSSRSLKLQGFREGWAWTPRDWNLASTDTGVGDPRAATAEKGRRYLEAVVGKVAGFLVEFGAASPESLYA